MMFLYTSIDTIFSIISCTVSLMSLFITIIIEINTRKILFNDVISTIKDSFEINEALLNLSFVQNNSRKYDNIQIIFKFDSKNIHYIEKIIVFESNIYLSNPPNNGNLLKASNLNYEFHKDIISNKELKIKFEYVDNDSKSFKNIVKSSRYLYAELNMHIKLKGYKNFVNISYSKKYYYHSINVNNICKFYNKNN